MDKPGKRVLVTLRRMIGSGELAAGQRLAEIPTAERLAVSRMPVRMAFRVLEQEGLLVKAGKRGYEVRAVTLPDIIGAVEVRGVLEGLAVRQAAEMGLDDKTIADLEACLKAGDALMAKGELSEDDTVAYYDMNVRFHETIIAASGNRAIADALSRNDHLPFASVKALAIDRSHMAREFKRLHYAHVQHHAIVEALRAGQAARAEALMREHAVAVVRFTDLFQMAQAHLSPPPDAET